MDRKEHEPILDDDIYICLRSLTGFQVSELLGDETLPDWLADVIIAEDYRRMMFYQSIQALLSVRIFDDVALRASLTASMSHAHHQSLIKSGKVSAGTIPPTTEMLADSMFSLLPLASEAEEVITEAMHAVANANDALDDVIIALSDEQRAIAIQKFATLTNVYARQPYPLFAFTPSRLH